MSVKNVFVTVGTTKFDELIESVTQPEILNTLKKLGYNNVTLQIGNGLYEPEESDIIKMNIYRLKPSIKEDIEKADLIISHAGAGSCLEILAANKPLIAIVNEKLMGNHQKELAFAMSTRGYLQCGLCSELEKILKAETFNKFQEYPVAEPVKFVNYLDKCMGIYKQ